MKKIIISVVLFLYSLCSYANVFLSVPEEFSSDTAPLWAAVEIAMLDTSDRNIYLYWGGTGGSIDLMLDFVRVMEDVQQQGKTITLILTENAYSAHAISACYADYIVNLDKYFLMFHPIADSDGKTLTDPDTVKSAKEMEQICVDKGILTSKDREKSLYYAEVYVMYKGGHWVRSYTLDWIL